MRLTWNLYIAVFCFAKDTNSLYSPVQNTVKCLKEWFNHISNDNGYNSKNCLNSTTVNILW